MPSAGYTYQILLGWLYLPIDVANVENLTSSTTGSTNLAVVADKLNYDGDLTKVGTHSEICDSCDQGDSGGDVVEETVSTGSPGRKGD